MSTDAVDTAACTVCELGKGGARMVVHEDDLFVVAQSRRYPWGLVIATQRHNGGFWTMTDDEAAAFGPLARRVGRAMVESWTDRVYLAAFGEEVLHFHGMLMVRNVPVSEAAHGAMYEQLALLEPQEEKAHAHAAEIRDLLRTSG